MTADFWVTLFSLIFFIIIGYLAKNFRLLTKEDAKKIIKFLFAIPLPVLVFASFLNSRLDTKLLTLPLISAAIAVILMGVSFGIGKLFHYERKTLGTLIVASGITATLIFAMPFIAAFYGTDSLRYLFLYDFGNGLIAWTAVYFISGLFGNKRRFSLKQNLFNFLKTSMLFALIGGIILSLLKIQLPVIFAALPGKISAFANPLILICIGLLLDFSYFKDRKNLAKLAAGALIVMGLSFWLALTITGFLGISGVTQKVVLLAALAPAATLTIVFSVEHDLDIDFASAIVAFTMFLGLIINPLFLLFYK